MSHNIRSYITIICLITTRNLKHRIPYTAVHTNGRDCTEQDGVVNRPFWENRIVFDDVFCFCVCFRTTKHGIIVLEKGLWVIFVLKRGERE